MSLWVLAGCALIGVFAGALPALWDGWQMRRKRHACQFATADTEAAEPGQILACRFCGEPARLDRDRWPVMLGRRERRRWYREQGMALR